MHGNAQMSINQKLALLGLTWVLATVGAGCRGSAENTEAEIDVVPLSHADPSAERPSVKFPPACQQADQALNAFVVRVLEVCEQGDYDGFCQFLGTTERPPTQEAFKRLWGGIREIEVKSVRATEGEKPQYFVHAIARLRKPDSEQRTERDIVIRIYRETDEWRISGAPKEITRKIIAADSQPASGPAGADGKPAASSRPAGARRDSKQHSMPSAAPATGHAVYKHKARTGNG